MKRIEFVTSRGTGHVEIPDDTTSIRIPKGICQNCDEDIEILTHSVFTNEQDVMATTDDVVGDPTKVVEKNKDADDDLEKMIPNL